MDKPKLVFCLDFFNEQSIEDFYIIHLKERFDIIIVSKNKLQELSYMCHCPHTAKHLKSYMKDGYNTLFVQDQFTASISANGYTSDNIIREIRKGYRWNNHIPNVIKFRLPKVRNNRSKEKLLEFVLKNINPGQQC